jgi:hypothetical protein
MGNKAFKYPKQIEIYVNESENFCTTEMSRIL